MAASFDCGGTVIPLVQRPVGLGILKAGLGYGENPPTDLGRID